MRRLTYATLLTMMLAATSPVSATYEISNETQETRKLQSGCSSTEISCYMVVDGKVSDLSCEEHLQIRRVDCPPGREVFVPVEVEYSYCNEEGSNIVQVADQGKTKAIFRGEQVSIPGVENLLIGGECKSFKIRRSVDLCKAGASMRMQYTSTGSDESGGLTPEFCYSFQFLQARRQFLPSGVCAIDTEVTCQINQPLGQLNNQPCKGNILRDEVGSCREIPVKFKFEVCNYFVPIGGFQEVSVNYAYKFKVNRPDPTQLPRSFAIYDRNEISFPFHPLTVNERCRSVTQFDTINTCSEDRTPARLRVRGRMAGVEDCGSFSFYSVKPTVDVDCQFIITEIADPKGDPLYRFVEIYALNPQCWGEDVATDDLYLVIFNGSSETPSRYYPIPLKGITVAPDGFHVFCATLEGQTFYGKHDSTGDYLCDTVSGEDSAADSDGNDQIAIIKGSINDFEVVDIYGIIGQSGTGTPRDFRDGRVVRDFDATNRNDGVYNRNDFFVESSTPDPHFWGPTPETEVPTRSPLLPLNCQFDFGENTVITEIVSEGSIRYIELYNFKHAEPDCKEIVTEMTLDLLDSNGDAIPESRIELKDKTFSNFGFIVLCTPETMVSYPYRCNFEVKPESVAGTDGVINGAIALQTIDGFSATTHDIFGYAGSPCNIPFQSYCFNGGSAYRQKDITTGPRDTFVWTGTSYLEWDIIQNGARDPDPDQWIDENQITTHTPSQSHSPSHTPTHSPSHAPSNSPTHSPSHSPSNSPSDTPSQSHSPSNSPSKSPSNIPSHSPSYAPSSSPSHTPTKAPTHSPTESPKTVGGNNNENNNEISLVINNNDNDSSNNNGNDIDLTIINHNYNYEGYLPPQLFSTSQPTKKPSPSPTKTPTKNPSSSPTSHSPPPSTHKHDDHPTPNGDGGDGGDGGDDGDSNINVNVNVDINVNLDNLELEDGCPNLAENIVITEIVAESLTRNFLEIHNLNHGRDGCHEAMITEDVYLDLIDENGQVPGTESIELKGMQFSPEGFIVLCTNPGTDYEFLGKCTHLLHSTNNAAGTSGQASAIAIQILDGTNKTISDVFGIPGETCHAYNYRPSYCFNGGSAVRCRETTQSPNNKFVPYYTTEGTFWYQWDISSYASTRDPDPNEWKYKHQTLAPSASPSGKPSIYSGGGKGKGKYGKYGTYGSKHSKRYRNLRS